MSEFEATCATYAEDLSALLDGELAESREVEVLRHLESCSGCTGRVEALRRVDAALAAASAPTVPVNLRARLDARLSSERNASRSPSAASREGRRTRWFARPSIGVATAAAASLALYIGVASVQTASVGDGESPSAAVDFDDLSEEDLAMALELDTIEDLEEIANLDLLVRLLEFEEAG